MESFCAITDETNWELNIEQEQEWKLILMTQKSTESKFTETNRVQKHVQLKHSNRSICSAHLPYQYIIPSHFMNTVWDTATARQLSTQQWCVIYIMVHKNLIMLSLPPCIALHPLFDRVIQNIECKWKTYFWIGRGKSC